ncbi:MAG: sulfatase-like hydrolase/transferase [Planctomycetota bacterium]|nr:sulfatase-like hydrolase/transferase [Planctomycetota bacterium]
MRIPFLLLLLLCQSAGVCLGGDSPPNILWILSDDQRADTIAALGNDQIETPSLDRLARHGVSFNSAYCMGSTSGAVCAPSRYMMMTGRSLHRLPGNVFNIPESEVTLPQLLKEAGWVTFFTGKWHNGKAAFQRSFGGGAEIFFGGMGSHTKLMVHDHQPDGKYPDGKRHPLPAFSSTAFADAAIRFIEEQAIIEEQERKNAEQERENAEQVSDGRNNPFFACVSFTAPHDPRTPPAKFLSMYPKEKMSLPTNFLPEHPFDNGELKIRDEKLAPFPRTPEVVKEQLAAYYAMISQMDAQVGRIIDALQETGLAENTMVVFTSDHGLAVGSHGLMGKQNLYEHSTRVPLLIVGPGIEAGSVCKQPVYLHDLVPTIADWARIDAPELSEGKSLVGLLKGTSTQGRESIYTAYKKVQRAIRVGRWKLIHYPAIGKTQLFDLQDDPQETTDLADHPDHQGTRLDLLMKLEAERVAAADPLKKAP